MMLAVAATHGCDESGGLTTPRNDATPEGGGPDRGPFAFDAAADAPTGVTVIDDSFGAPGAWPQPWRAIGGVDRAEVSGGVARLSPEVSAYSLARMHHPGSALDFDARFRVRFSEPGTQGAGFYVRQNGGYLRQTTPRGQGYAAFLEGFRAPARIGVWRELDGVEQEITTVALPGGVLLAGVDYLVRFTVTQDGPTSTRLHAEVTRADQPGAPPTVVDTIDSTIALQERTGGVAIDAWSTRQTGGPAADISFDDVRVTGR